MTEVEIQAIEERLEMVDEFKDNWEQLATQDVFALLTHIRAVEAERDEQRSEKATMYGLLEDIYNSAEATTDGEVITGYRLDTTTMAELEEYLYPEGLAERKAGGE